MIPEPYLKALRRLHGRLADQDVTWVLTGSASFAIQGMQVALNDVDMQTDKEGAYKIESLFEEHSTRKVVLSETNTIRSHFGALSIEGIKVEIMGDIQKKLPSGRWTEPPPLESLKFLVTVDDMQIPVLPLAYERQAYLDLGRPERASQIEEFLRSRR